MPDLNHIKNLLIDAILSVKSSIVASASIVNIKQKSHQDYVTNLDHELEDYLLKTISAKLPDIKILSEETIKAPINISNQNCIVIDPLDGTLNAISELPYYSTSIAYIENGTPKIGITYDFIRNELFYASTGEGMFINGIKVNRNSISLDKKPIAISNDFLIYYLDKNPDLIKKIRNIAKIRILGSQTLHLAYVASGRLRANFNLEAKFWDDAAGFVMLKEMGMEYINFQNQNIFPKKYIDPEENLMSFAAKSEDIRLFITNL